MLLAAWAASASAVSAHPGHDDGHELTWDLGHFAAHPLATLGGLAVLAVAIWAGWRIFRERTKLVSQPVLPRE